LQFLTASRPALAHAFVSAPPANDTDWCTFYLSSFLDVIADADRSRPLWPLCPAWPWAAGVDLDSNIPNGEPLKLSRTGSSGPPWEGHIYYFDLCKTPETCGNCVDDSFYPPVTYASEFGWIGTPSFETLAPVLTGGNADYTLTSPGMTYRQNTIVHMTTVYNMVAYNFGRYAAPLLNTSTIPAFRSALHLGMLAQADCVRAEVEHYRRGRNGPENTHGTMFWMLGAIWPAPSWDSLEYGGRWKMLHYSAREFYHPIALDAFCSPSITNCSAVTIHIGNEQMVAINANVSLEVLRYRDGGGGAVASWPASLPGGSGAGAFFSVPSTLALLASAGCSALSDCLLRVHARDLSTGLDLRAPALRSLTIWADANLEQASISITALGGGKFSVSSDVVAPHTMLHAAEAGHFDPNNLLLLPGQAVTTTWIPGPAGPSTPTGVYALTINGASASAALYDALSAGCVH
jgi:beta-mannosidase